MGRFFLVPAQEISLLRLPHVTRSIGALAIFTLALVGFGSSIATSEPASISQKRAQVQRIQAELDGIDQQVEAAAEEYNGAQYQLGKVKERIGENRQQITTTVAALKEKRVVLAQRLRDIYATPEPSLAEVLITSGSITAAADQVDLLDRVGQRDADVVGGLRDSTQKLQSLRAQLVKDRATSQKQVAAAQAHKASVEALMSQRQAVLESAKGDLGRMLAAQQARERAAAAAAAQAARQRVAATAAATTSSGTPSAATPSTPAATPAADPAAAPAATPEATPAAAPQAAPALPSGSGNAAAASAAMSQLGVPYRWGGASPSGFDCSGLASWAYAQIGKSVPHYTVAAYNAFPKVPSSQLQPGDLVFFRGLGHMGIYIGGGQYVHAPQTGDVVKVSSVGGRGDYVGATRP